MIRELKRYVRLDAEEGKLEERLKKLRADKTALEKKLLDGFEKHGVQNINLQDKTVYLHHKLVARPKGGNREAVVEALKACGLTDYIETDARFNTASLEAFVREHESNGNTLPDALRETLEITNLFFLRVRKAS